MQHILGYPPQRPSLLLGSDESAHICAAGLQHEANTGCPLLSCGQASCGFQAIIKTDRTPGLLVRHFVQIITIGLQKGLDSENSKGLEKLSIYTYVCVDKYRHLHVCPMSAARLSNSSEPIHQQLSERTTALIQVTELALGNLHEILHDCCCDLHIFS